MTPERAFKLALDDADEETLETLEAGAAIYARQLAQTAAEGQLVRCEWVGKGGFTWCPEHGRYLLKCRR